MGKNFKRVFDRTKNSVKVEGRDYVICLISDEFMAFPADAFFERKFKLEKMVCYLASENQNKINAIGGKHGYRRSW